MENMISILESESQIAINCFKDNHMIADAAKFHTVIFDKRKNCKKYRHFA